MIKYFCDICDKEVIGRTTHSRGSFEATVKLKEMDLMVSVDVRLPSKSETDALCDSCKMLAVKALLEERESKDPRFPEIPEAM